MEQKSFTGWIDGHFVKGTFTEKNDHDFKEENEKKTLQKESNAKLASSALKAGVALLILVAMASGEKKSKG